MSIPFIMSADEAKEYEETGQVQWDDMVKQYDSDASERLNSYWRFKYPEAYGLLGSTSVPQLQPNSVKTNPDRIKLAVDSALSYSINENDLTTPKHGNELYAKGAEVVYLNGVAYAVEPDAVDDDHKYYWTTDAPSYGDYLFANERSSIDIVYNAGLPFAREFYGDGTFNDWYCSLAPHRQVEVEFNVCDKKVNWNFAIDYGKGWAAAFFNCEANPSGSAAYKEGYDYRHNYEISYEGQYALGQRMALNPLILLTDKNYLTSKNQAFKDGYYSVNHPLQSAALSLKPYVDNTTKYLAVMPGGSYTPPTAEAIAVSSMGAPILPMQGSPNTIVNDSGSYWNNMNRLYASEQSGNTTEETGTLPSIAEKIANESYKELSKAEELAQFAKLNEVKQLPVNFDKILELSGGNMDLAKRLLLSTKEAIPGKTIPELVETFKLAETPAAGSLSGYQTRIWYKWQESLIGSKLDYSKPLEEVARDAFNMRNSLRTTARESMADTEWANHLMSQERNKTFEELVREGTERGLSGDALWNKIIESSMKSRGWLDSLFGL